MTQLFAESHSLAGLRKASACLPYLHQSVLYLNAAHESIGYAEILSEVSTSRCMFKVPLPDKLLLLNIDLWKLWSLHSHLQLYLSKPI